MVQISWMIAQLPALEFYTYLSNHSCINFSNPSFFNLGGDLYLSYLVAGFVCQPNHRDHFPPHSSGSVSSVRRPRPWPAGPGSQTVCRQLWKRRLQAAWWLVESTLKMMILVCKWTPRSLPLLPCFCSVVLERSWTISEAPIINVNRYNSRIWYHLVI